LLAWTGSAAAQSASSSSALIGHALDGQLTDFSARGGLLDVINAIENQTGIRIEAEPAVWDALPWGQDTSLSIHVKNTTVREAMNVIARRLGLNYRLGSEAVVLSPSAALARLGRRATLQEIHTLDWLAATPLGLAADSAAVKQILDAVNGKLAGLQPPLAVQDRAFDEQALAQTIHVAPNATMMEALDEIDRQTAGTWYPWGRTIVVCRKIDAVRLLLSKRLSRQFKDEDLQQVLADLAQSSGVEFSFAPGVLQKVPEKFRRVTLTLDEATVEQTLQIISGATGLKFSPTDQGVDVTFGSAGQ
jgi:hypothetical protein